MVASNLKLLNVLLKSNSQLLYSIKKKKKKDEEEGGEGRKLKYDLKSGNKGNKQSQERSPRQN